MKKLLLFLALYLATFIAAHAQPLINQYDMPNIGDTIRVNLKNNFNDTSYKAAGANLLWDFSTLQSNQFRVDTFVKVSTTPIAYQLYFADIFDPVHLATLAQPQPDVSILSYVQFTKVYYYFKTSASSYTQVGQGSTVNGVPMSIAYNSPDLLYNFPLTLGDKDSSFYSYNMQLPSLGYYGESRRRINLVDGWGTVITPYDTFPAMRVLSTSYIHDTIHLDTFGGIGLHQDRTELEYKWLADTMGIPVFKVTKRVGAGNAAAEYINKYVDHTSIPDFPYTLTFVSLYPDPAEKTSAIYFALAKTSHVKIDVLDVTGRILFSPADAEFPPGFSSINIGTMADHLYKGIYFIRIVSGSNSKTLKFLVR